jgi:hypothetical protein
MYVKARDFIFFPLLFGSRFGSASVANNNWGCFLWNKLTNPHSQVIRILYHTGLFGLWLYIFAFYKQTKLQSYFLPKTQRNFVLYTVLLLIGLRLVHRSTTIFIYTGILLATMTFYQKKIDSLSIRKNIRF